ncbi:restriction endonuclease subunit S [Acidipropionibacterium acidipropionici]|uniref:restriction endonuclease subunit S n=1 Tax=Acidipropionibacterium acidipropionici TaxID=1748 RepID=UPI00110A4527|nr:restriction endonuclease subunit S [Acidipropionibacterium acidipropionici]QCV95849.1 restriction endonuclease subunit S [Acidipropionibacterium acidipropionici]
MKFSDLGLLFDGPHATPKRLDNGPYYLNITSLDSGRLDLESSDHVSEAEYTRWTKRVIPQEDDLLFSYETRLGEAALMPPGIRACLGRRMALLRPDRKVVHPKFLLYYYLSPKFQGLIDQRTVLGATVPRILLSEMPDWPVHVPSLPDQQAIAEVLGALDDKIAANRKLVTTSLNLVQALHDQLSTTGDVTRTLYTDVAEVGGGATPKTRVPEYWDGDIHWASPTDITALGAPYLHDTSRHITQAGLDSCSSPLYPAGSILMTSRATIGAFAVAQEPAAVNQGFIVLIPKREELRWWLLHEMMGRVKEFQNRANGATFLELSKRTFKTMEFDLPSDAQLLKFDEFARPLHEHAIALGQESQTLAQLRDTLLPALMDGTIRVKDAERLTEEAV